MMDIGDTIETESDRLNAADLISGPKIIKVTRVIVNGPKHPRPTIVHYEGDDGKPWIPCKNMRRLLVALWGNISKEYLGKNLELFRCPNVKWAGKEEGGIRIRSASHINNTIEFRETYRGYSIPRTVKPLREQRAEQENIFDKDALITNADKVSEGGLDIYKEWFGKLSKQERQILDETGTHERIKALFNQKPLWEVLLEKANNAKDEQEVSSVQAEFDARENEVDMDRQSELQTAIDDALSRIKQETEG